MCCYIYILDWRINTRALKLENVSIFTTKYCCVYNNRVASHLKPIFVYYAMSPLSALKHSSVIATAVSLKLNRVRHSHNRSPNLQIFSFFRVNIYSFLLNYVNSVVFLYRKAAEKTLQFQLLRELKKTFKLLSESKRIE